MLKRLRSQLKKAAQSLVASRERGSQGHAVSWPKDDRGEDEEVAQLKAERERREREYLAERNREPWFVVYKRHSGQQQSSASRRKMPRERLQPRQAAPPDPIPCPSPAPPPPPPFDLPPDVSPIELWRRQQQNQQRREELQRQEAQQLQRPRIEPLAHQHLRPPQQTTRRPTTPHTLAMHPLQRARVISALTKRQLHRFRQRKLLLEELKT
uniref:Hepatoma-derived growth factor-related protein 2-like n=1 Tax=Drosophila rhopaloa TaxID=1041015 RepID=A0A6P4F899_DRORH